jgi:homoserine kinase
VVAPDGLHISIEGEGAGALPVGPENLVIKAAESVFSIAGCRPAGLSLVQRNGIPVSGGLGSSAAAVVAGIMAADRLVGAKLSDEAMVGLATQMEGHPDNVAPALYGGLTLVNREASRLVVDRIHVPPMWVTIVMPEFDLPTQAARAVLPEKVLMADAVFNIARTAALVRALETGDFDKLRLAMQDRLHQRYRAPLIPGMVESIAAARGVGAAVALSGAGPSLAAFVPEGHQGIAQVMTESFARSGVSSRSWILPVDKLGSQVIASADL